MSSPRNPPLLGPNHGGRGAKFEFVRITPDNPATSTNYFECIAGDGAPSGNYGRAASATMLYARLDATSNDAALYVTFNGGTTWTPLITSGAGGSQTDLIFDAATELTIAAGAVTATQGAHTIDTEADAASDDLDTIAGGTAEEILFVRPANAARTVVLKHAIGANRIACLGGRDVSLAEATDWAMLAYDGTQWVCLAVSTLADGILAASSSWTGTQTFQNVIYGASSELTIAAGVVAATRSHHTVDTEADAASDDLDSITGGAVGEFLLLRAENAARTVVLKHAVGANLVACLGARDISLAESTDWALLMHNGTQWTVVAHSTLADGILAATNAWTGAQTFQNLLLGAASELTIAAGAVAATRSFHTIDTEADAASDDLDDITGGAAGELLLIRPENAARTVVLRHAIGANKIATLGARNISLAEVTDWALLVSDGTQWAVLAASTLADGLLASANSWSGAQTFGGGAIIPDGAALALRGLGTGTGDVIEQVGATATEAFRLCVYDETVSPNAVETNLINLPAGSMLVSVQGNVQTALTGGGTTVTWSIGTGADPDKYGSAGFSSITGAAAADSLAKDSRSVWFGDGSHAFSLSSAAEQLVLTGAATGGAADGNTALTAGTFRCRVIYWQLQALDNAP